MPITFTFDEIFLSFLLILPFSDDLLTDPDYAYIFDQNPTFWLGFLFNQYFFIHRIVNVFAPFYKNYNLIIRTN